MTENDSRAVQAFTEANRGRDYGSYGFLMDAPSLEKAGAMFPHFGDLPEGAKIVDNGSGTGTLSELAASYFHGAKVIALDISHELMEQARNSRALVDLKFGDVAEQHFPDNSIDVHYFSTSGHEVESFGGAGRMAEAVRVKYRENKPGGKLIIRDFMKPSRTEPVLMELLSSDGTDNVEEATHNGILDYTLLSDRALFDRFHKEFGGGDAFDYEIVERDGREFIKLSPEWAHEFYLRKDYRKNWKQEIKEKYTYWNEEEARSILESAGYEAVQVIPNPNDFIITNRLKGKIGLYEEAASGELQEVELPSTHMVVTGSKPRQYVPDTDAEEAAIHDTESLYSELKSTIHYDEANQVVSIGDLNFPVDPEFGRLEGSKKNVYRLAEDPSKVLKVVRTNALNDHALFKSMFQSVAREDVLDAYKVPHVRILEKDSEGPPYRYFIQEAAPENALSAAELIRDSALTEEDVKQMARMVNEFELKKEFQLDTNPFNWYRVPAPDGTATMLYVDGKVYPYDEVWDFKRVGLLQWISPEYVINLPSNSAGIPKALAYEALCKDWEETTDPVAQWWKKYLSPKIQPGNPSH